MRFHAGVVALFMVSVPSLAEAQNLNLIPGVSEVASEKINDIAIAVVDLPDSVIYYKPSMFRRYGPMLSRFFLAHEYGHFARGHSRLRLTEMQPYARDSVLRIQELEADCYAAALLGNDARNATEAALRFFSRLGPFRFDNEHPTGAQRAAQILECLPAPRLPVVFGRGDTGVEIGPVSGEPERIQVQVRALDLSSISFGNEATLWIDGQRLGEISNMRTPRELAIDHFGAGLHSYRIDLRVFSLDSTQQFTPHGNVLGRGQVLLRPGDRFRVQWAPGERPTLEPDTP
jgi:hypothetical protein